MTEGHFEGYQEMDEESAAAFYGEQDAAMEAWERQESARCTAEINMGHYTDPFVAQCIKYDDAHEDPQFNDQHVGYDPFLGPLEPGEEREYVVWQGTDSHIAGDLHRGGVNKRFSVGEECERFRETEYEEQAWPKAEAVIKERERRAAEDSWEDRTERLNR
jgi:hypothetical protein